MSDALSFLVEWCTAKKPVNYLNDYLFLAYVRRLCELQIKMFLDVCKDIGMPVAPEKTVWPTTLITFLGFLIDSINCIIAVPLEKIMTAKNMIEFVLQKTVNKPKRKQNIMVLQLQKICGFLNFLSQAVVLGRAFTRRLYSHLENKNLKQHHHIRITDEMVRDLVMWNKFVTHPSMYYRSFMDFSKTWQAQEIEFYMNASKNFELGYGGYCQQSWFQGQWMRDVAKLDLSIQYLELYALAVGVINWIHRFANKKIAIFSDNMGVVSIVNSSSSKCKNCMVLIHIIVLHCLVHNVKIYAKYIKSSKNEIADSLSHFQMKHFNQLTHNKAFNSQPTAVPEELWPITKIWLH